MHDRNGRTPKHKGLLPIEQKTLERKQSLPMELRYCTIASTILSYRQQRATAFILAKIVAALSSEMPCTPFIADTKI